MSRFFSLIFLLFLTFSLPLAAQEIWMEPSRFHFEVGESAAFTFRKGEDFVGKTLSTDNGLVSRMEHHTPSKKSTLLDLAAEAGKSAIHMSLAEGGTHVILAETALEEIVWEGNKFSERLKNGALDDVTYARRKAGILSERATELSSHHIKTLLHAGTETDDAFAKVFGLPIEIIPNKNPAGLKKGDPIAFKVIFNGKPLFAAKVRVLNRHSNRISVQNIFSQKDGVIETHISNPGAWMVSVTAMVPSSDDGTRYRSYVGTLVFGVL